MLLKLLFLAIVLYYVVKTSKALVRAISGNGPRTSPLDEGRDAVGRQRNDARRPDAHDDVEDAKYVDI